MDPRKFRGNAPKFVKQEFFNSVTVQYRDSCFVCIMGYVEDQQKRLMLEKLQSNSKLTREDMEDIVFSLQVATGRAWAVGRVKGILQYLQKKSISIEDSEISDNYQLAKLINSMDPYIEITSSREFKDYF